MSDEQGTVSVANTIIEDRHARLACAIAPDRHIADKSSSAFRDDLSREVYCILGMPIDAMELPAVLRCIEAAVESKAPFVLSTPNLNFLKNSQQHSDFRESLLSSDLCPVDGMPIIWIARLAGVPIKRRVAGSDIFEALKSWSPAGQPLKVFLFGATESIAAAAAKAVNIQSETLRCIGWACPGFGTVEELSADKFIEQINSSGANFLIAALGAQKGQLWLQRNHHRLRIPVRAHLGATINFQAGAVRRAPLVLRKLGLEWLWRIKEEPHLWIRYWTDGIFLLRLMAMRVLPLALSARSLRRQLVRNGHDLVIDQAEYRQNVLLSVRGYAVAHHIEKAVSGFRGAMIANSAIVVDFSETEAIDARFFGLLLMVRKQLKARGSTLKLANIPKRIRRSFRLHGLEYLLVGENHDDFNNVS